MNTFNTIFDKAEPILNGIFMFLVILTASYFLAKILRAVTIKTLTTKFKKRDIATFISDLLFYALMVIGITAGLSNAGMNVGAIIASLGLAGFAIGFALKDVIGNFVSGLLILLTKTFESGDYIKVSNFDGEVKSINLRHTIVKKLSDKKEEQDILIPNSIIFSSIVVTSKKSVGKPVITGKK